MTEEVWTTVEWAPDYEVSNKGRVVSHKRDEPLILKPQPQKSGHLHVTLCVNGVRYITRIHRLVAEAFIPNPEGKPEVAHENGDPRCNQVENLRWSTHGENHADRKQHGTSNRGSKHGLSKLTDRDVLTMRKMYVEEDWSQKDLGVRFGINRSAVSSILNGKRWGHLPGVCTKRRYNKSN